MIIIAGDNRSIKMMRNFNFLEFFSGTDDKETEKATVPPDRPQIRLTTANISSSIESDISKLCILAQLFFLSLSPIPPPSLSWSMTYFSAIKD